MGQHLLEGNAYLRQFLFWKMQLVKCRNPKIIFSLKYRIAFPQSFSVFFIDHIQSEQSTQYDATRLVSPLKKKYFDHCMQIGLLI